MNKEFAIEALFKACKDQNDLIDFGSNGWAGDLADLLILKEENEKLIKANAKLHEERDKFRSAAEEFGDKHIILLKKHIASTEKYGELKQHCHNLEEILDDA